MSSNSTVRPPTAVAAVNFSSSSDGKSHGDTDDRRSSGLGDSCTGRLRRGFGAPLIGFLGEFVNSFFVTKFLISNPIEVVL
uniref:Uncharacterized protein n=1 Tax=Romanomermis culicivorax TaxID=13658 RepID=A0A915JEH5_ROMCU